jgi:hypothetical protein
MKRQDALLDFVVPEKTLTWEQDETSGEQIINGQIT